MPSRLESGASLISAGLVSSFGKYENFENRKTWSWKTKKKHSFSARENLSAEFTILHLEYFHE